MGDLSKNFSWSDFGPHLPPARLNIPKTALMLESLLELLTKEHGHCTLRIVRACEDFEHTHVNGTGVDVVCENLPAGKVQKAARVLQNKRRIGGLGIGKFITHVDLGTRRVFELEPHDEEE